jgi:hypothetical protein
VTTPSPTEKCFRGTFFDRLAEKPRRWPPDSTISSTANSASNRVSWAAAATAMDLGRLLIWTAVTVATARFDGRLVEVTTDQNQQVPSRSAPRLARGDE